MDHQMSQTVLCIFYKSKKLKLKKNKQKENKNPPGAHTQQACSATLKSGLKHNTHTGGVEQKELSASIPERDFSLFPLPFRIGPIREQLLWNWALSLASCFLLATVGGWDTHTYKTHTESGWGCGGGWLWRQSVLFSNQIGDGEPPAVRRRKKKWCARFNYYIIHIKHLFIKTNLKQAARKGGR